MWILKVRQSEIVYEFERGIKQLSISPLTVERWIFYKNQSSVIFSRCKDRNSWELRKVEIIRKLLTLTKENIGNWTLLSPSSYRCGIWCLRRCYRSAWQQVVWTISRMFRFFFNSIKMQRFFLICLSSIVSTDGWCTFDIICSAKLMFVIFNRLSNFVLNNVRKTAKLKGSAKRHCDWFLLSLGSPAGQ